MTDAGSTMSAAYAIFILIVSLQFATITLLLLYIARIRRRNQSATLVPGKCECGHSRCDHQRGQKKCMVDLDMYRSCACQCYIPDNGACADVVDDEVRRLRKMAGI